VYGIGLAEAADADATQRHSRGGVRLRVRMLWADGGVAAARSVFAALRRPPKPAHVVLPRGRHGRRAREAARFAVYGEHGDDGNPLAEAPSTQRVRDRADEILAYSAAVAAGARGAGRSLVAYERPARSALALVAWESSCSNGARALPWCLVFFALWIGDTLAEGGAGVGGAQLPLGDWARLACGLRAREARATAAADVAAAERAAVRDAAAVVERAAMEVWRAKYARAAVREGSAAHGKAVFSLNPLAPLLRPIQRSLLRVLRPLRVAAHALDGRSDPVLAASLCACAWLAAAVLFAYAELLHRAVARAAAAVAAVGVRALGVALFGPQNFFYFARADAAAADGRRRSSLAGFNPRSLAASLVQRRFRRRREARARAAADAVAAAAAEKDAARHERARAAAAEAERAAVEARAAADAAADRESVEALNDVLDGAVEASKCRRHVGGTTTRVLSKARNGRGFVVARRPGEAGRVHAYADVRSVAPADPARPRAVLE